MADLAGGHQVIENLQRFFGVHEVFARVMGVAQGAEDVRPAIGPVELV